jgi:hypothetical protein
LSLSSDVLVSSLCFFKLNLYRYGAGKKFFDAEAALNRRLKNSAGVASFVGVAGANAYLVWKDEGRTTLDSVLNGRGGGITSAMGVRNEKQAVKAFSKQLLQAVDAVHKSGVGSYVVQLLFVCCTAIGFEVQSVRTQSALESAASVDD